MTQIRRFTPIQRGFHLTLMLTFVIQSRDNEQNARLSQAGSAALYHRLRLQYRALVDELAP